MAAFGILDIIMLADLLHRWASCWIWIENKFIQVLKLEAELLGQARRRILSDLGLELSSRQCACVRWSSSRALVQSDSVCPYVHFGTMSNFSCICLQLWC